MTPPCIGSTFIPKSPRWRATFVRTVDCRIRMFDASTWKPGPSRLPAPSNCVCFPALISSSKRPGMNFWLRLPPTSRHSSPQTGRFNTVSPLFLLGCHIEKVPLRYIRTMAISRVELPGSQRPAPSDAVPVGAPAPDEPVQISVVLRRRNALPPPGESPTVSREQFAELYGADPADIQKVVDFAAAHGLTVVNTEPARRTVVLSGPLSKVAAAFTADVQLYQQGDLTYRARSGVMTIPADLAGVVEGVFGFDQRPQARAKFRILTANVLPAAA